MSTNLMQLENYLENLKGRKLLPGDRDPYICTNWAIVVSKKFGGAIHGYTAEFNPEALVGQVEGGHDFLVIDDHIIVDPWVREWWPEFTTRAIFDLNLPSDAKLVRSLYGSRENWETGF